MASTTSVYSALYADALRTAWRNATRHAWTFLVPVALLALGVFLDAWIEPLDPRAGALASAAVRGLSWGAYFYVLLRLAVGARAESEHLVDAVLRRSRDLRTLVTPVAGAAVLFLAVQTTGCLGASLFVVAGLAPVVECFLFDGGSIPDAATEALDFLKARPVAWGVFNLGLVIALGVGWLATTSAVSLMLWLADASPLLTRVLPGLVAAVLLGPAVHLMMVFRAVLFQKLRRCTHAQRMFRARVVA